MNQDINKAFEYIKITTAHYLMKRLENLLYNEELVTGLVGADKIWSFINDIKKEFNIPEDELSNELDFSEPENFQSIEELINPNINN